VRVTRSLRACFIIFAEYSCFPRSRLFPSRIYSGQFFVCEHPQIYSPRRIILLIRYSYFYALRIFPNDSIFYQYFNDVNNFQNFNNYSSGIYLDWQLNIIFQLFIEIKVFQIYKNVILSLSFFAQSSLFIQKPFIKLFLFNTLIIEKFYIEKFPFFMERFFKKFLVTKIESFLSKNIFLEKGMRLLLCKIEKIRVFKS